MLGKQGTYFPIRLLVNSKQIKVLLVKDKLEKLGKNILMHHSVGKKKKNINFEGKVH